MKKENYTFCFVFAMGVEARPFLKRVEVKRRWKIGHATHREVFFEGDMILVVRSGIGFEKALTATKGVQGRPTFILSVGTCGALTPDLSPGDLLIADETVLQDNPNERIKCSESAVENLERACSRAGLRYKIGPIATAAKPIFHRTERERLQHTSGAYAVDMESHAIATGASSIGSSFGVIRVVSDGMEAAPLPDRNIITKLAQATPQNPRQYQSSFKMVEISADLQCFSEKIGQAPGRIDTNRYQSQILRIPKC